MRITIQEFLTQLTGARTIDEQRWTNLHMEKALLDLFAFDDGGAWYLDRMAIKPPDGWSDLLSKEKESA